MRHQTKESVVIFADGRRIDMSHTIDASRVSSMTDLRYEYRGWLNENNLPKMSAENLLRKKGLSNKQRAYLKSFILRWVSAPANYME